MFYLPLFRSSVPIMGRRDVTAPGSLRLWPAAPGFGRVPRGYAPYSATLRAQTLIISQEFLASSHRLAKFGADTDDFRTV